MNLNDVFSGYQQLFLMENLQPLFVSIKDLVLKSKSLSKFGLDAVLLLH